MSPIVALALVSLLAVLFGITGLMMAATRDRGSPDDAPRTPGGIAGLKAAWRAGDRSKAVPSLLVIGGLLGMMIFGALALIVVFGQTGTGMLMLLVAIYAVFRVGRDFRRA
jgi:hypothetical protein